MAFTVPLVSRSTLEGANLSARSVLKCASLAMTVGDGEPGLVVCLLASGSVARATGTDGTHKR